ncbi:MAG: phosphate uptake regulator PhoU [Candidatus Bathyarchaeota archaeon]|nr:phosphate uptake regulator PhoU [Candidatus Termiticorpusculum sp.]
MNRLIDVVLEDQSVLLSRMGELTYQTLLISIKAYIDGTTALIQVRDMSDRLMLMADKVEDRTFELIARFQPVASDLRTIKSYMKISYDFARYGRYALDISFINDQINGLKECKADMKEFIEEMSTKVLQMVAISVDALRKLDVNLARTISQTEREVDQMYLDHLKKLFDDEHVSNKCILSSTLMARYLERIADHAVYVCEAINYIVTGEKTRLR